ncbi:MAG: hypothetical protein Q4D66_05260 [Bacteroidales bacterium]|nr:hypothetical protein [Bacteroidales bacterium]
MTTPSQPLTYWVALTERYFDGLTTEAEERSLRLYLAHSREEHPTILAARAVMGLAAAARRHATAPASLLAETSSPLGFPPPEYQSGKEKILRGTQDFLRGTQNFPSRSSRAAVPSSAISSRRLSWHSLRPVAAVVLLAFVVGTGWWSYDYLNPRSVAYIEGHRTTDPALVDAQMHEALRDVLATDGAVPSMDQQLHEAFSTLDSSSSSP